MKVLLLETEPGVARQVSEELTAAGHEVARCHESGSGAFACNGLLEDHTCPLEEGVDVAVAVSDSATVDGVRCTLRRHVPLVIGAEVDAPYAEFATARADGDVVGAIDRAVAMPLERHGRAATRSLRAVLETHGYDGSGAVASVHRRGTDLVVRCDPGQPVPKAVADVISVRTVGAVRDIDPYARIIDVSVAGAEMEAAVR